MQYQVKKEEQARVRDDQRSAKLVMNIYWYSYLSDQYGSSAEGEKEQYYEEFLSEKRVELMTEYLKKCMDREYPGIGYGTTYEEITMDRLRNGRVAVGEEFIEIEDILIASYDTHLTYVMGNIIDEMRENGDL
ncbi:MAG: hypothetical protein ACK5LL_14315 [Suipraeoptans sp.]